VTIAQAPVLSHCKTSSSESESPIGCISQTNKNILLRKVRVIVDDFPRAYTGRKPSENIRDSYAPSPDTSLSTAFSWSKGNNFAVIHVINPDDRIDS
jgi:hypothetical protein